MGHLQLNTEVSFLAKSENEDVGNDSSKIPPHTTKIALNPATSRSMILS